MLAAATRFWLLLLLPLFCACLQEMHSELESHDRDQQERAAMLAEVRGTTSERPWPCFILRTARCAALYNAYRL